MTFSNEYIQKRVGIPLIDNILNRGELRNLTAGASMNNTNFNSITSTSRGAAAIENYPISH